MPSIRNVALAVLGTLCLLYLCGTLWLYCNQRKFLYPAPAEGKNAVPRAGETVVRLRTDDGLDLSAIYRPARSGRPTIVFFHGNGDSLAGSQQATQLFAAAGYGLLLPEYRGYGGNPGLPSEQGLYRDGRAALTWLTNRGIGPASIVVIGNSLGTGIATQMAAEHRPGALVLISGFTRTSDIVQMHLPFIPARWLVRDRYDNVGKIGAVACPVLLLHGAADTLIPARHSVALAQADRRIDLDIIPDKGHELAYTDISQRRINAWLNDRFRTAGNPSLPAG